MWRLKKPSNRLAINHLETVLTLKNGDKKHSITEAEKKEIKELYKIYDSNEGQHEDTYNNTKLDSNLLDKIELGYNEIQINGRLKKLRERLLLNAKRCPCCGISEATTLDHHLPKNQYKVLSVYVRNLVAYCHICNNKKRTVSGVDADKRFIHPYFCPLPNDIQFLFAKVSLNGKRLTFSLYIKKVDGLSDQMIKQMEFMMKKVKLHDRLLKELNVYLTSIASYVKSDYENGGKNLVAKNLKYNADLLAKEFSLNHWRHSVIQALSEHEKFCDGGFYEPWSLNRN